MKQFVLPKRYRGEGEITVAGQDYRYLCRVRRHKRGDDFMGIDRDGRWYRLVVDAIDAQSQTCRLRVEPIVSEDPCRVDDSKTPVIRLFQCLPKANTFVNVVRQATECGIASVVPMTSEHSLDSRRVAAASAQRWRRVIIAAAQQSGTRLITEIADPMAIQDIPSAEPSELGLFFHHIEISSATLHGHLSRNPSRIAMVVGPEGGLSDRDIALLQERGYLPVYLGGNVLRVDTAVVAACASIGIVLQERSAWKMAQ